MDGSTCVINLHLWLQGEGDLQLQSRSDISGADREAIAAALSNDQHPSRDERAWQVGLLPFLQATESRQQKGSRAAYLLFWPWKHRA